MGKMVCRLMVICFLAVSLGAFAQSGDAMNQDTMKAGDQMKHDDMKADHMSKKVSLSGKVSEDGKMFVSDKDNKNKWTGEKAIKGTDLKGHGLLSDKVDGRSWIVDDYLKKLMEGKALPVWQLKAQAVTL